MDLPSSRELELETLLRLRDTQLAELTDELTHLRLSLASHPGPSTSDPVTLPPALVSVILPHLRTTPAAPGATGSNTVNAALAQRARLLQEENDEMYDLLKQSETGKLKEEILIKTELGKSYESLTSASANNSAKSYTQSPRIGYNPMPPPSDTGTGGPTHNGSSKLPPTGPRAHKKPRLSDPHGSPTAALQPHNHKSYSRSARGADTREYAPRRSADSRGKSSNHVKMEVDDDQRVRPPSRERNPERERERDRGGGRERERDGHRSSHRRNGNFGGGGGGNAGRGAGGGGGGRRHDHGQTSSDSAHHNADRTLRERMGL
ncbi:hypothetical protein DXG03_000298 [Asterophora parasitica]|uniref:Uncharacterized protein n=1 Tax=Asterophora parasitica TaxID=117018 RepID=A0A9P7GG00_9AGAR|nr:hypothetical protein DXG03_000298 [Asterophora parasitica]